MKSFFLAFSLLLTLTGCDKTVTGFVAGARPPNTTPGNTHSSDELSGFKLTPGRLKATSSDMAIDATVTPTNRLYSAGDLSVKLTLSRGHPQ